MKLTGRECPLWCGGVLNYFESNSILCSSQLMEKLQILKENDRDVYFSLVGYEPESAEIAIIGLNPAFTQLNNFCDFYQRTKDFDESRKLSAFSNPVLRGNLVKMLDYLNVGSLLGMSSTSQLFSDYGRSKVLMTSVVKCASLNKNISKRSSDWGVLRYSFAVKCAENRLMYDLEKLRKLRVIFVLGKKAIFALKNIISKGKILYDLIESRVAPIIEIPHPSGANNGSVSIFIEEKCDNSGRIKNRYLSCLALRQRAKEIINEIITSNNKPNASETR